MLKGGLGMRLTATYCVCVRCVLSITLSILLIMLSTVHVFIFLQFEHSVAAKVCKAVLESYNMSFRDCLKVVHTKVEFMNSIIVKLGGSEKLAVDHD